MISIPSRRAVSVGLALTLAAAATVPALANQSSHSTGDAHRVSVTEVAKASAKNSSKGSKAQRSSKEHHGSDHKSHGKPHYPPVPPRVITCSLRLHGRSAVIIDIDPDSTREHSYTFRLERLSGSRWVSVGTYRTSGHNATRVLNVPRGTYRATGFSDAGKPAFSGSVTVGR